jgi:hypothetical protein
VIETIALAAVTLLLVPAFMVPIVRDGVHRASQVRGVAHFEWSSEALETAKLAFRDAVQSGVISHISPTHWPSSFDLSDEYRTPVQQRIIWHFNPPFAKFGDLVSTTIHATPPRGSSITPCCGAEVLELPRTDQISSRAHMVNCQALADAVPAPHSVQYVTAPTTRTDVLVELVAKLKANDIRWGEQNHPDLSEFSFHGGVHQVGPAAVGRPFFREMAKKYQIYNAERASTGTLDWTGILLEEVYEALAEYEPALIRAELLDAAAVLVAWVEAIDRRAA